MRSLLPLLLAGCNQSAADGYRFERAEWFRSEQTLAVVAHPNLEELRKAADKAGAKGEGKIMAWGAIGKDRCTIHIVDPVKGYAPEYIGHEVTHCIYGRWHP
jgi:hypothetical protein